LTAVAGNPARVYDATAVKLTHVRRSRVLVALAIATGLALCALGGLDVDGLLCLAPALVLAATLLGRRYPGERLLNALSGRARPRRARRASLPGPARARRDADVPRGGLLMGFALAVRPPPAPSLAG
jgi:hypothetical protein